jgi:hypothetical protein
MVRLGLEGLVNQTVRLVGRVGGATPGRKVLTLVAAILAGGSHIDHADKLRAGATEEVLPFRVMAPSTLGTFLRAFTFGHVRQLDAVIAETIRRAWNLGAGPGASPVTIDLDSTICEVHGKHKHGAAYGYTRQFGYHPVLATRADTGEVLHARLRKGSSQRGHQRFVEELVARVRTAAVLLPLNSGGSRRHNRRYGAARGDDIAAPTGRSTEVLGKLCSGQRHAGGRRLLPQCSRCLPGVPVRRPYAFAAVPI